MYVIAIHEISDPETFWAEAGQIDLPDGTELPTVAPNEDGTRAICLWKSDSVDTVKNIVEGAASEISSNQYYAVNEGNAQGLPG